jgi:hypothetical protein
MASGTFAHLQMAVCGPTIRTCILQSMLHVVL